MDPFDLLFLKPGHQLPPTFGRIAKTFGARLSGGGKLDVEPVFGNVDTQRRGNHAFVLSLKLSRRETPHRSTLYTGSGQTGPRIPFSLHSGAWKSGALCTARGRKPEGTQEAHRFSRCPAGLASRRAARNVQETRIAPRPPHRSRRALLHRSRRALLTHRACMGFRMSSADSRLYGFIYVLIQIASDRRTSADCWAFLRRSEGNPPFWRGSSRHKLVFG